MGDGTGEKVKGVAKEALGKVTGDGDLVAEGEQQQAKAQKDQEAERLRAEAAAKQEEAAAHEGEQRRHQD